MAVTKSRASIEERLQALEDKEEILNTMYQYAHALDYGKDPAEFTDCFTDDGVWYSTIDSTFAGTSGVRLEGRPKLAEWFSRSSTRGTPGHFGKHIMVEPRIRIDGDRATVRSYFSSLHQTEDGPLPYSMGQYLDVFVRSADGRWRIKERHLSREGVHKSGQDKAAG